MFFTALALAGVAVLLFPDAVLPPSAPCAVFALWAISYMAGRAFNIVNIPPLLGMLVSGICLQNFLPKGTFDPITPAISTGIRSFGLCIILMIAGLEIDLDAVRRIGWVCLRLTVLPGVSEAIALCIVGRLFFGMPLSLSLSMGFIIGAVSPAVVVTGMFKLQRQGYGAAQGIPSLIVAAASLDDIVAISGFSMAIGAAFAGDSPWYAGALDGPVNMIIGLFCGTIALGIVTAVWTLPFSEGPQFMFSLGLCMVFTMKKVGYSGSGFLGCIVMCAMAAHRWKRKGKDQVRANALHMVEYIWGWIAEPLLFGVIGLAFDFSTISASTIPLSCIVVLICVCCVRVPMAFFAVSVPASATTMTYKERLFIALVWVPKATVQAALASVPLEMAMETLGGEELEQYKIWCTNILTTAVCSIFLTAPLGLMVIQLFGTTWLRRTPEVKLTPLPQTCGKDRSSDIDLEMSPMSNGQNGKHAGEERLSEYTLV